LNNTFRRALPVACSILIGSNLSAQVNQNNIPEELELNTITTAVPFLTISPDARGGALGDAGVSTSPDANSIHWNPAKLAFMEGSGGASITYSPWLRTLVNDISLSYVSTYFQVSDIATMGASLKYFSLGDITFTDINGNPIGDFTPNEWSLDVAYAMKLSEKYSFGMAVRWVNSNLTQGITVNGQDTRPARSVAADVSGYYTNDEIQLGDYDATLRVGANISNIGAKMRYTDNDESDFLPTTLRLGPSLTLELDDYNTITFLVEASKLLVPTPPIYRTDSTGTIIRDPNGDPQILAGRDPNVSVVSGMFGSFTDAPGLITGFDPAGEAIIEKGSVTKEELREINISTGVEYWYDNQFAVRLGYFYEHPTKGNRQYATVGLGLKLSVFSIDVAYLIGNVQRNPLANTARFSLKFDFDAFSNQNQPEP
tara:strand:- start:818 stop:2098 length:1281 start_codon:yes stop_codon:yes gene_type:complete